MIQEYDTFKNGSSLPSGEKATVLTSDEWPSSVCSAAPVAASQSRTRLVVGPRHDLLAVGREGDGIDIGRVALERLQ